MKLPFRTPITLWSPLAPAQITSILQPAILPLARPFASRAEHPFRGHLVGQSISLRLRQPYKNIFQRVLRLSLTEQEQGTRLHGSFTLRLASIVTFSLWFLPILFVCLFSAVPIFRASYNGQLYAFLQRPFVASIPWGLALLGFAMLRIGLLLSHRAEARLLARLANLIDARPTI